MMVMCCEMTILKCNICVKSANLGMRATGFIGSMLEALVGGQSLSEQRRRRDGEWGLGSRREGWTDGKKGDENRGYYIKT